jgi:hypothetical protein
MRLPGCLYHCSSASSRRTAPTLKTSDLCQ